MRLSQTHHVNLKTVLVWPLLAVTEALSQCLAELVMNRQLTRGIIARGLVSLVLAVIWVPFTLVITQNKFDSDENSSKAEQAVIDCQPT